MTEAGAYQCPVCGAFARDQERSCRHCSTLLATLRCGHCFELSFPDDLHCRGCGAELGLGPLAEQSRLVCPDCQRPLEAFSAESGTLHACQSCGGQLVSHGLLRALLETREVLGRTVASVVDAPRGNPLTSPVRYRPCPACSQLMHRRNFGSTSGIVTDVCSLHGSFFDAGELPRVLEFVRRGGLQRAKAELQAKRPERPSMAGSMLPEPPRTNAADGSSVMDLLEFVLDLLLSSKK
ncbi:MAG TPA: zf-TFIIB domain-containing protein [Polyangiaceae bacterium]